MMTILDAAARHNVKRQRILKLLNDGRIKGCQKIQGEWMLPDDFVIEPPPKRNRLPDKITTSRAKPVISAVESGTQVPSSGATEQNQLDEQQENTMGK